MSLAEDNIVVGLFAEEGTAMIIISIAVCIWTSLLEDSWIVLRPICWLASLWSIVGTMTTVLISSKLLTSTATGNYLTGWVALLQLLGTDLVQVLITLGGVAPVIGLGTAWIWSVWIAWLDLDLDAETIDQTDIVVVVPALQSELGKRDWGLSSSLHT